MALNVVLYDKFEFGVSCRCPSCRGPRWDDAARRHSMTPATRNNAFVLAAIATSVIFATRLTGYRERGAGGGGGGGRGDARVVWWRRD
jgi:hypothetical protein